MSLKPNPENQPRLRHHSLRQGAILSAGLSSKTLNCGIGSSGYKIRPPRRSRKPTPPERPTSKPRFSWVKPDKTPINMPVSAKLPLNARKRPCHAGSTGSSGTFYGLGQPSSSSWWLYLSLPFLFLLLLRFLASSKVSGPASGTSSESRPRNRNVL